MQSEIRAACIQVLFSAVYHLKSAVLPYSSDLLKLSLKALGKESEKVIKSVLHKLNNYFSVIACTLVSVISNSQMAPFSYLNDSLCAHTCVHTHWGLGWGSGAA